MPRICPWCVATLADDAAEFCSDYCREQWHRHIIPPRGLEQVTISRPAPLATVREMAVASRAMHARRRWLKAQQASAP